jgi:chromosome segregation ATPase
MPQDIMRGRKKYLAEVCRDYHADGLIVESNKFCEYWSYERTIDALVIPRDYGIPTCSIEKEYINSASGQLRTRFQAFVESVELKRIQKMPAKEEASLKEMVESVIEDRVEKAEERIEQRKEQIEEVITGIEEKKTEIRENIADRVEQRKERIEEKINEISERRADIRETIEDRVEKAEERIDYRKGQIEDAISGKKHDKSKKKKHRKGADRR